MENVTDRPDSKMPRGAKASPLHTIAAAEKAVDNLPHQPNGKMPRGAKASPIHQIEAAITHKVAAAAPTNILYVPNAISFWGNNQHGDCVTAEEAFAKACYNPEIFVPEQLAIDWASDNGDLEGAVIHDVLVQMTKIGFRLNGSTYNDGNPTYVHCDQEAVLQNAISIGPVKVGVNADQLDNAYGGRIQDRGWFAVGFNKEQGIDHCISLCGYGTLSWLAGQFGVPLPNGVNGQASGYAFFTWNSIGIIDYSSLLAISGEAWLRNPTTIITDVVSMKLEGFGGETGHYLSHAFGNVSMQPGYQGTGEAWACHNLGNNTVSIECLGGESGRFLSHAFNNVSLQPAYQGAGELWRLHDLGNNKISIECMGGESGHYLSHAFNNVSIQPGYQGAGEMWANTGRY